MRLKGSIRYVKRLRARDVNSGVWLAVHYGRCVRTPAETKETTRMLGPLPSLLQCWAKWEQGRGLADAPQR